MNELAQYLIQNMLVDFEGEVTTDGVRAFLREDSGHTAMALLQKIIEEKGIDELLIAIADCLTAEIQKVISTDVIIEHLTSYSES